MHRLWKIAFIGSNKPGKQTVHGLKCHLEKCHIDIYTLYTRKVESRQQGPPAKKVKLDKVLAAHCRADLVIECMKKKKTLILSGDFRFSAKNKCPSTISFRFRPLMEFHFRRHFRLRPKMKKMLFVRPLVAYTSQKGLGLGLEMQSLGLGLQH